MYQVNCQNINCYDDFIEEFNKVLIRPCGGEWNGNLDAFNDYLSWPGEPNYKLEIIGTDRCEKILNYVKSPKHEKPIWALLKETLDENSNWVTVTYS